MADGSGYLSAVKAEIIGQDSGEIRFVPAAEGLGKCASCANRTCALPTSYGAFDVKCSRESFYHRARERCTGFVLSATTHQRSQLQAAA